MEASASTSDQPTTTTPTAPDLDRIFADLVRVEIDLWNAIDRRLAASDAISLAQAELLAVIDERGSCRVSDIAAHLAVTVGGVSRIVDRAEREGFVRREPNPEDRRSSRIGLTDAGRRELAASRQVRTEALGELLGARLDPARLAALGEALAALRAGEQA